MAGAVIVFPIETPRLRLRPFTLEDAVELHRVWGDPASERWGGPYPRPETVADTRRYLEPIVAEQAARGYSLWAVVERASGRIVGDCGLFLANGVGPDVELAYGLGRAWWGRGYATEAASACLRVGFGEVGLRRIVADADPANAASLRVLEKLGFEVEREAEGKLYLAATASRFRDQPSAKSQPE
jgi:ribosomal-protein-alanine N-acetyltransferase